MYICMYTCYLRAPRFKGFQQQDSHELLRYLLDAIRGEEIKVSWNYMNLLHIFHFVLGFCSPDCIRATS